MELRLFQEIILSLITSLNKHQKQIFILSTKYIHVMSNNNNNSRHLFNTNLIYNTLKDTIFYNLITNERDVYFIFIIAFVL